jgi:hypothetical protein
MRIYRRRESKQTMQMAIDRLQALKAQTVAGSSEEAYYQTLIDRYNEKLAA